MIVGVKGTGKTKTLISMVNAATELSAGSVVCIEKGTNLRFNVKYQARLINVDEYNLTDAQSLYGFIAGVYASNQDITHIFVDGTYRICNKNIADFEQDSRGGYDPRRQCYRLLPLHRRQGELSRYGGRLLSSLRDEGG